MMDDLPGILKLYTANKTKRPAGSISEVQLRERQHDTNCFSASHPSNYQDQPGGPSNTYTGAVLSACDGEGLDNSGVDVEQVIPGHSRLARHTCRDHDELAARQGLCQLLFTHVTLDLFPSEQSRVSGLATAAWTTIGNARKGHMT